jgi:hypothetical protein
MRTKEEQREYNQNYYQIHREQIIKRSETWWKNHKGRVRKQYRKYQRKRRKLTEIKENRKIEHKNHYEKHKKEYLKQSKKWRKEHPKEMRIHYRKHCAKRRKLGFIPLNQQFIGSDGHHIDENFVVYIPHDLHISISHNVWTGHNISKINDKAFEWLIEHGETQEIFIRDDVILINQVIKNELPKVKTTD